MARLPAPCPRADQGLSGRSSPLPLVPLGSTALSSCPDFGGAQQSEQKNRCNRRAGQRGAIRRGPARRRRSSQITNRTAQTAGSTPADHGRNIGVGEEAPGGVHGGLSWASLTLFTYLTLRLPEDQVVEQVLCRTPRDAIDLLPNSTSTKPG